MLYAGCSNCRSIVPLWCAGRFMPHMPAMVEPSPMGPYCAVDGPLPPIFTCMMCGMTQGLYVQGMSAPPSMPMGAQSLVALAVQAPPNAPQGQVKGLVAQCASEFVKQFVGGVGSRFGQAAGSGMAGWM